MPSKLARSARDEIQAPRHRRILDGDALALAGGARQEAIGQLGPAGVHELRRQARAGANLAAARCRPTAADRWCERARPAARAVLARPTPPPLPRRRRTTAGEPAGSRRSASCAHSSASAKFAAPAVRLGLDETRARRAPRRRRRSATARSARASTAREVVAAERLLGGALIPDAARLGARRRARSARRAAIASRLAGALQPLRRRGGGRARDRSSVSMPYAASRTSAWRKAYSASPGKRPSRGARDHLALAPARASQPPSCVASVRVAEQRGDAAAPEDLAEHARRAQHAPRLGSSALEARLHHRQHRLGQLGALALGGRADQLLEVERVAGGALDDARDLAASARRRRAPARTSRSRALRDSSPRRISCTSRSAHSRGKSSCTSGRASASTMSGRRAGAQRGVDEAHRRQSRPSADPRARAPPAARGTRRRASPPRRGASDRPSASGRGARRGAAGCRRRGTARRRARRGTRRRGRARPRRDVARRGARAASAGARRAARRRGCRRRGGAPSASSANGRAGAHRIAAADPAARAPRRARRKRRTNS